jgi:hypothetical protein
MKAQAILAAVALLAACHASAQSASSSAGSYDWGQSQVQKMYQSPYARSSDALAATAERKRLVESRSERDREDKDATATTASATRKASGGKLACLGMGSTLEGGKCHTAAQTGLGASPYQQYQQQMEQQRHPLGSSTGSLGHAGL